MSRMLEEGFCIVQLINETLVKFVGRSSLSQTSDGQKHETSCKFIHHENPTQSLTFPITSLCPNHIPVFTKSYLSKAAGFHTQYWLAQSHSLLSVNTWSHHYFPCVHRYLCSPFFRTYLEEVVDFGSSGGVLIQYFNVWLLTETFVWSSVFFLSLSRTSLYDLVAWVFRSDWSVRPSQPLCVRTGSFFFFLMDFAAATFAQHSVDCW